MNWSLWRNRKKNMRIATVVCMLLVCSLLGKRLKTHGGDYERDEAWRGFTVRHLLETNKSNIVEGQQWLPPVLNSNTSDADETCTKLDKHAGYSSACEMAQALGSCSSGTYFEYIRFHYCAARSFPLMSNLLLVLWLMVLFFMLGNTAADYFCPSLEKLSEILHLPPTVAGVTLLPLGNGAPDVFASIASFIGAGAGQVGLNSVFGAALFVTCVVAGSASIAVAGMHGDTSIDGHAFARDIGFLFLATLAMIPILAIGRIHLWGALSFFSIYIVYGATVSASEFFRSLAQKQERGSPQYHILQSLALGSPAVNSALHSSARRTTTFLDSELLPYHNLPESPGEEVGGGMGRLGRALTGVGGPPHRAPPSPFHSGFRGGMEADDGAPGVGQSAAELSLPQWMWTSHVEIFSHGYRGHPTVSDRRDGRPLWGFADVDVPEEGTLAFARRIFQRYVELPLEFPRRVTIPVVEEADWSRKDAVASAVLAPLLFAFVVSGGSRAAGAGGAGRLWGLGLAAVTASGICGGLAYAGTEEAHPPRQFLLPWVAGGFAMSVVWFYLIANELVAVLVAFGVILEMDSALLGLTVLAWGNSIGDFVANLALACNGSADGVQIAMSGCYAAPMFNTLVGLGLSLVLASWHSYPLSFVVPEDKSLFWTLGFLLIGLCYTAVVLPLHGMRPTKTMGIGLLSIYASFIVLRVACLMGFIAWPGLSSLT